MQLIQETSPGDFGQLAAILAHEMHIPLVVSWHTNLHQFAARRLKKLLEFLPENAVNRMAAGAERNALRLILRFYKIARVVLAPTPAQVAWLRKPGFLMIRGVDSELFHPRRRTCSDGILRLGFVGRVTPEKGWDAALAPVFEAYRYCQTPRRTEARSAKLRALPSAQLQ